MGVFIAFPSIINIYVYIHLYFLKMTANKKDKKQT
jgi:hypothetical protein